MPATFEMRTRSTLGTGEIWSIGSLDVKPAFLIADLTEDEDW